MIHSLQNAVRDNVSDIADLWHQGWHDAHKAIVPAELVHIRTLESFHTRVQDNLAHIRVLKQFQQKCATVLRQNKELEGFHDSKKCESPLAGFHMLKHDEVYQFFLSRSHRGKGLAAILMKDAETQLKKKGVTKAWLACAIGNERAASFYRKAGWTFIGEEPFDAGAETQNISMNIWRFEKQLSAD